MVETVAVVGGGVSGLAAAKRLVDNGFNVTVYDRGRQVGGRLASRPIDRAKPNSATVDHGASFIAASDPTFLQRLKQWQATGIIEPWPVEVALFENFTEGAKFGTLAPHPASPNVFVGVPNSNAIAQFLSEGLTIEFTADVSSYQIKNQQVELIVGDRAMAFDHLIVAMPIEQAARLTDRPPSEMKPGNASSAAHVAMFEVDQETDVSASWIEPVHADVARLIRDSDKPGRHPLADSGEAWTLQTTHEWSHPRLAAPASELVESLTTIFCAVLSLPPTSIVAAAVHRWTFGFPSNSFTRTPLVDGPVIWTGDWVSGGDVEGAFLAGEAAADVILSS